MLDHAVVIGGGFAGLVFARVLADYYKKVTIIESDQYSTKEPSNRSGVPQDLHIHTLLLKGRQILQEYFPVFDRNLEQLGAPLVDYTDDCLLYTHQGRLPRFPSGIKIRPCQRHLIDWVIKEQLLKLSNVAIIENTRVTNLNIDNNQVTGVCLKSKSEPQLKELTADLVVDCSGRNSKLGHWLQQNGIPLPEVSLVQPYVGYASRLYEIPEGHHGWKGIEVAAHAPNNPRAAGLWEVEGNKWLLTLIGTDKNYPPKDEVGYLGFAKMLATSKIYDAIKDAKPLTPIRSNRSTDNQWRHYEKYKKLPLGLLVAGSSHCSFNPYYGQGMSVIALTAKGLEKSLQKSIPRFSTRPEKFKHSLGKSYFKNTRKPLGIGWLTATFEDSRWPATEGLKSNWLKNQFYRYLDSVLILSLQDEKIAQSCIEMANMTKDPSHIARPYILSKVLGHYCHLLFKRLYPGMTTARVSR